MILRSHLSDISKQENVPIDNLVMEMALSYCNFAGKEKALYQVMFGLIGVSLFTKGNPKEGENLFYFIKELLDKLVMKNIVIIFDYLIFI